MTAPDHRRAGATELANLAGGLRIVDDHHIPRPDPPVQLGHVVGQRALIGGLEAIVEWSPVPRGSAQAVVNPLDDREVPLERLIASGGKDRAEPRRAHARDIDLEHVSRDVSRTLEVAHQRIIPEYLRSAAPTLAAERTHSLPFRFDGLWPPEHGQRTGQWQAITIT